MNLRPPSTPAPESSHGKYEYDWEGFLGFPRRKGVDVQTLHSLDREFNNRSLVTFCRSWLFDGLLSEFSAKPGQLEFPLLSDDPHRTDVHAAVTSITFQLRQIVRHWRKEMEAVNSSHIMKLTLVINTAKFHMRRFLRSAWWSNRDEEGLIIGIVGETLEWALAKLLQIRKPPSAGWAIDPNPWYSGQYHYKALLSRGWCPSEIYFLQGLLQRSPSGLYYASTLPQSKDEQREPYIVHGQCSKNDCEYDSSYTDDNYRMRHTLECQSSCELLQPSQADIHDVLRTGHIPLLGYGEDTHGSGRLYVKRFSDNDLFVVVSHVWRDGLGNPQGNAMLACQVKRLTELVRRFSQFQGKDLYFWIDSICVPVSPREIRVKAIRQMFDVYSMAHSTVVMSAALMEHLASKANYLELATRISTSSWMRRLWTFQEGAMSRNLYFLFKDDLVNIEDLDALYPAAASESVFAAPARSFYTNLLRPRNPNRRPDAALVSAVWRAIQWRTTTHPADETLAIAPIFGLDKAELEDCIGDEHASCAERRMELFLRRLPEIPGGMIFMDGKRSRTEGLRWAPLTWMLGEYERYPDPLSTSKPSQYPKGYSVVSACSVLTDRGLLVRYPGYRLHEVGGLKSPETESNPRHRYFPIDNRLDDWYCIENPACYQDSVRSRFAERLQESGAKGDLAVIHDRASGAAVLVLVHAQENGCLHCKWLVRAELEHCSSSSSCSVSSLRERFEDDNGYWTTYGEALGDDQIWLVD